MSFDDSSSVSKCGSGSKSETDEALDDNGAVESCDDGAFMPPGPSKLAENLRRLKCSTWGVIEKRERLPQPLFWSLFHAEVRGIKKRKEKARLERALFLSGVEKA